MLDREIFNCKRGLRMRLTPSGPRVATRYYGLFLRNLDPGERGQIRSPHGLSAEARPS
jgi:hypothetical protein